MKKLWLLILTFVCSIVGCKTVDAGDWTLGTVRYIDLEGGFYAIEADDGARYDPMGLDEGLRKDGTRLRFRFNERSDVVGFHQWGKIVQLTAVERIE